MSPDPVEEVMQERVVAGFVFSDAYFSNILGEYMLDIMEENSSEALQSSKRGAIKVRVIEMKEQKRHERVCGERNNCSWW